MKRINKNNSGFTLVELIIAMAVLAVLMTAVASLMGSSVATHKKQKAEIKVHTSAQETYNQISDSIMQAREVVIIGYEVSGAYDFSTPGEDVGEAPDLVYYVKDETMKDFIISTPDVYGTDGANDSNVKFFADLDDEQTLYVNKIAVMTSVPIDLTLCDPHDVIMDEDSKVVLKDNLAKAGEAGMVTIEVKETASGLDAYAGYDNVVHIYTFEGANMYYEKHYSYMTALNDMIDPANPASKDNRLYNDGLSYVSTSDASGASGADISGCSVTIDTKGGAIGVDLDFNSRNMTYTTKGMINIRNSYVLKGKDN